MKMADLINGGVLILGMAFFIVAVVQYTRIKRHLQTGIKTEAKVIENVLTESSEGGRSSIMYQSVMEFTASNTQQRFVPNIRSNPPAYTIGQKVSVVYAPHDPQTVYILSYWGLYLTTIILLAFAMPMLTVCGGYFLFKLGLI